MALKCGDYIFESKMSEHALHVASALYGPCIQDYVTDIINMVTYLK